MEYTRRVHDQNIPSNWQSSLRRQILASTSWKNSRDSLPLESTSTLVNVIKSLEVQLKDNNRLIIVKWIVEAHIKSGDDVAGLIIFPHQFVLYIVEVYPTELLMRMKMASSWGIALGKLCNGLRTCSM